jgi:hypothetical protein
MKLVCANSDEGRENKVQETLKRHAHLLLSVKTGDEKHDNVPKGTKAFVAFKIAAKQDSAKAPCPLRTICMMLSRNKQGALYSNYKSQDMKKG